MKWGDGALECFERLFSDGRGFRPMGRRRLLSDACFFQPSRGDFSGSGQSHRKIVFECGLFSGVVGFSSGGEKLFFSGGRGRAQGGHSFQKLYPVPGILISEAP